MTGDLPPPALPSPATVAMPWVEHFPRAVPQHYDIPPVELTRLLDDAVQDFPDGVALLARGRRWTYRLLLDVVDRFAATLVDLGVGRHDRVVVALPAGPQAVTALFGCWRVGAVAVLCDHEAEPESVLAHARHVRALLVVAHDRRFRASRDDAPVGHVAAGRPVGAPVAGIRVLLTGAEDELPFPGNIAAMLRRSAVNRHQLRMFDLLRRRRPFIGPVDPPQAERTAVILLDDRTELAFTHAQLVTAAFHLRLWLPDVVAGAERIVSSLPLHTALGLAAAVTMPVLAAATMVATPTGGPREIARMIDRSDPTVAVLASPQIRVVVDRMRGDGPSLRVVLGAGIVERDGVIAAEERTAARIRGVWAPHGSAGIVAAEPIYGLTRRDTVGIPVTDTRAVVVDPRSGHRCEPGAPGRLLVSGPQVIGDAFGRPPDHRTDGWWDSGCHAAMDADGFLTPRTAAGGTVEGRAATSGADGH